MLLLKVRVWRAPQQRRPRGELFALERRALRRVLHVWERLPRTHRPGFNQLVLEQLGTQASIGEWHTQKQVRVVVAHPSEPRIKLCVAEFEVPVRGLGTSRQQRCRNSFCSMLLNSLCKGQRPKPEDTWRFKAAALPHKFLQYAAQQSLQGPAPQACLDTLL